MNYLSRLCLYSGVGTARNMTPKVLLSVGLVLVGVALGVFSMTIRDGSDSGYPKRAVIKVIDDRGRWGEVGATVQVDLGDRMFVTTGFLGAEWIVDTYTDSAFRHRAKPYHAVLAGDGERIRFYRDLEFGDRTRRDELFWTPVQ